MNGKTISDAISYDTVNGKQVVVLHFPDKTWIHLVPFKIEGGQDPRDVLLRWLSDWCKEITEGPLSAAWCDIYRWIRLAEWQREEIPHNTPWCPNSGGIVESEAVRRRIQEALKLMSIESSERCQDGDS